MAWLFGRKNQDGAQVQAATDLSQASELASMATGESSTAADALTDSNNLEGGDSKFARPGEVAEISASDNVRGSSGLNVPVLSSAAQMERVLNVTPAAWLASYRDPTISLEPLYHEINRYAPTGVVELDPIGLSHDVTYADTEVELVVISNFETEQEATPQTTYFAKVRSGEERAEANPQTASAAITSLERGTTTSRPKVRMAGRYIRADLDKRLTSTRTISTDQTLSPRISFPTIPLEEVREDTTSEDGTPSATRSAARILEQSRSGRSGNWGGEGLWQESQRANSIATPLARVRGFLAGPSIFDIDSNSYREEIFGSRELSLPVAEIGTDSPPLSGAEGESRRALVDDSPVRNFPTELRGGQFPRDLVTGPSDDRDGIGNVSKMEEMRDPDSTTNDPFSTGNDTSLGSGRRRLGIGKPLLGGDLPIRDAQARDSDEPRVDSRTSGTMQDDGGAPVRRSVVENKSEDFTDEGMSLRFGSASFFPNLDNLKDSNWVSAEIQSSISQYSRRSIRGFGSPLRGSQGVPLRTQNSRGNTGDPPFDGATPRAVDSNSRDFSNGEFEYRNRQDLTQVGSTSDTSADSSAGRTSLGVVDGDGQYDHGGDLSLSLISSLKSPLQSDGRRSYAREGKVLSATAPGGVEFVLSSDRMAQDRLEGARALGLTQDGRIDIASDLLNGGDRRALGVFAHELTHLYQQRAFQSRGISMPHPASVEGRALESQAELVRSNVEAGGSGLVGQFSQAVRSGNLAQLFSEGANSTSPNLTDSIAAGLGGVASSGDSMPVVKRATNNASSGRGGSERGRTAPTTMRFVSPIAKELGIASQSPSSTPKVSSGTSNAQPLGEDVVNSMMHPREENRVNKEVERDDSGDETISQIYREVLFRLKSDLRWERDVNSSFGKFYRM